MRARIPVRPGPLRVIYGSLITIWLLLAGVREWLVWKAPHENQHEFMLQMIALAIYIVGFLYLLWWLARTFTGETLLTLTPSYMRIQHLILGIELSVKSFPTHQIDRVVYAPPDKFANNQPFFDPGSSRIQFRAENITYSFGKGILQTEAKALIEQMLKIYAFPRSYIA